MEKTIRSDFLVHWTGKDIQTDYTKLKDCEAQRYRYIRRLLNTIDPIDGGLWMNRLEIEIPITFPKNLDPKWPATCFTEIRLSRIDRHTKRYGCLGFGFSREFIMEFYGAPVQYIAGPEEKGTKALDMISANYKKLMDTLRFFKYETVWERSSIFKEFVEDIDLMQFLREHNYGNDSYMPTNIFDPLLGSVISCAIFVKQMSDKDSTKFELLDEAEWRIPYTNKTRDKLRITMSNENGLDKEPFARIPFTQEKLKVLIFPDDQTRIEALNVKEIRNWLFDDPANLPIIATVEECLHF